METLSRVLQEIVGWMSLVAVFILWLFVVLVTLLVIYRWVSFACLCCLVRLRWYPGGKRLLFVYSNSPNWKDYLETNILPKVAPQAVVLNWSERKQWPRSLARSVFRHWAFSIVGENPGREFNPIAIAFVPWWWPETFRFWQAFKDFKHGNERRLKETEAQLYRALKLSSDS